MLELEKDLKDFLIKNHSQPRLVWGMSHVVICCILLGGGFFLAKNLDFINVLWLVPLIGWIYYRVYFPLHELSHFSLLPSRKQNIFWGYIFAGVLFTPFDNFRKEHLLHHRFYGSIDDPGSVDYYVKFNNKKDMLLFLILPILGFSVIRKVNDYLMVKPKNKTEKNYDYKGYVSIFIIQLLIFSYITDWQWQSFWRYPVFILLPGITVFLFLSRLRMFLEHGSLNYQRVDFTKNPSVISRSFCSNFLELSLLSGAAFKYHYEHHLLPGIPACELQYIHEKYIYPNYISNENYRKSYWQALKELWSNLP